nr:EOG090X0JX7 [Polyphemus pediculus]
MAGLVRFSSLIKNHVTAQFNRICRLPPKTPSVSNNFSTKPSWELDTNVIKDVILYSHENPRFHKVLNIFALSQLFIWIYLAEFSLSLKDAPVNKETEKIENLPWYRKINMGENKFKNGITTMCVTIGMLMLGGSWLYSLKSIRNIVLRKGGKSVTIVTYGPFNKIRYIDAPLKNVSATQSRARSPVHLPLKVKGYMGFFMVDMKGQFKNIPLFDATVGLKRSLK